MSTNNHNKAVALVGIAALALLAARSSSPEVAPAQAGATEKEANEYGVAPPGVVSLSAQDEADQLIQELGFTVNGIEVLHRSLMVCGALESSSGAEVLRDFAPTKLSPGGLAPTPRQQREYLKTLVNGYCSEHAGKVEDLN